MVYFCTNKETEKDFKMNREQELRIAINEIGFAFFKKCMENGATAEQAQKEMMRKENQKIIAQRILEIMG